MYNKLIEWGRGVTGDILPEGRLKEFLRSLFERYYHPMDFISGILSRAELQEDGALCVELKDGAVFLAYEDQTVYELFQRWKRRHSRRGSNNILMTIERAERFGTLWREIIEQYRDDIYQKRYRITKGDVIMDVGAHIGTFTVRAAAAVGPEGKIVAIEPEPDNLSLLRKNIRANKLQNVVILPKGAWSSKDRLKLFSKGSTGRYSLLHGKERNGFTEVEVDTLDNMLRELRINKVDFIKMDIEGAEIEAYQGMKEILKDNDVKLAIAAYHTLEGRRETHSTIAHWLSSDGFKAWVKKGIVYAQK